LESVTVKPIGIAKPSGQIDVPLTTMETNSRKKKQPNSLRTYHRLLAFSSPSLSYEMAEIIFGITHARLNYVRWTTRNYHGLWGRSLEAEIEQTYSPVISMADGTR